MRKMRDSGSARCSVAFSARADARSRPNGFSTTTRAPSVQPAQQLLDDRREHAGRDGKVVQSGAARPPARARSRTNVVGVGVVAVDVAEAGGQRRERGLVDPAAVLGQAGPRALDELRERPPGLRDAHDRKIQVPASGHRLQRREDLLVGEIARRAEEHQRVGAGAVGSQWGRRHLLPRMAAKNRCCDSGRLPAITPLTPSQ